AQVSGAQAESGLIEESPAEALPTVAHPVLVIDDDPSTRDLLQRFLSRERFGVVTASSGAEGLRLAQAVQPVAIILDVLMPELDGWAVLMALKADPMLADIPVIMLTIVDDKNRGYALGATEYLTKPVDRDRLVKLLNKYQADHLPDTVLLVEDDTATRQLLRRLLTKEGWQVHEAANGQVTLEQVADEQPGLILLDLLMPEMDGFTFVAELRKHQAWRSIPIVVLTSKDLTQEERQRLNGHVEKILQKGEFTREELLREVRELVAIAVRQPPEVDA
ncbi:MAG: response regulator, partial [Chloroflexota bacterium]|nr:response regulator [Chloroflexota bacterium]